MPCLRIVKWPFCGVSPFVFKLTLDSYPRCGLVILAFRQPNKTIVFFCRFVQLKHVYKCTCIGGPSNRQYHEPRRVASCRQDEIRILPNPPPGAGPILLSLSRPGKANEGRLKVYSILHIYIYIYMKQSILLHRLTQYMHMHLDTHSTHTYPNHSKSVCLSYLAVAMRLFTQHAQCCLEHMSHRQISRKL